MANINWWAVIVSTISAFVLGGIWYAPRVFGNTWLRESGVDISHKKSNSVMVFSSAFVLALIAAIAFAYLIGARASLGYAISVGLIVGIGWIATSFGVNYLFAQRSLKLFLIDAGYHAVQFLLYGIIFGLWH